MLELAELRQALEQAVAAGRRPVAYRLHPATEIHVSDPALGLPPLRADEMDALDALPVVLDAAVAPGTIEFRED